MLLIGVEFADEFASGVPYATAFAVQGEFSVGVTALNAWTFLVPQLVALVVEPYLLLKSEGWGAKPSLLLGLCGMATSLLLGALAWNAAWLGLAVALYFPSSGLACGVAQILLVQDADQRETSLTDWTLAGTLGDLATPGFFWLFAAGGLSWRWTFVFVGLCVGGLALTLYRTANPELPLGETNATGDHGEDKDAATVDAEETEPPLREALRLLAGNRALLWWLLATASCSLLDELFAAQLGVHIAQLLTPRDATSPVAQQLMAASFGATLGLLVQRALLRRHRGVTLLAHSCLWTLVFAAVWLFTLPNGFSLGWMVLLGAAIAPHYPLAQAQAYAALPRRPSVVAAASQAFTAIDLVYPLLVGLLSDHVAPVAGLGALLVQPIVILFVVAVTRRGPPQTSTPRPHREAAERRP